PRATRYADACFHRPRRRGGARDAPQRPPPPAAGNDCIRAATGSQVYERRDGQLAAIARRVRTFSAAQPCDSSLNNFIAVARFGPTTPKQLGAVTVHQ